MNLALVGVMSFSSIKTTDFQFSKLLILSSTKDGNIEVCKSKKKMPYFPLFVEFRLRICIAKIASFWGWMSTLTRNL